MAKNEIDIDKIKEYIEDLKEELDEDKINVGMIEYYISKIEEVINEADRNH